MLTLTLDILKRTFRVGIVIFDSDYNIVCINETMKQIFGIDLEKQGPYNLANLHPEQSFGKIKKMVEEAQARSRSGSYVIKIYKSALNKEFMFLGKVFLLHGQCRSTFIALLYDVTTLLVNEQNFIAKFPVYEGEDFLLLDVNQIDFFAAQGNYTQVVFGIKKYLSPLGLGEIERKLHPGDFMRIHKSFIVNIKSVQRLKKGEKGYRLLMKNGADLPLSRNKVHDFLKLFGLR